MAVGTAVAVEAVAPLEGYYEQLAHHYEQAGDLHSALLTAHRAVAADALREEAHFELIRLYAAAGRPQSALRCYRELEQILRRELDLNPDAPTRALARSIAESVEQAPALRGLDISAAPDAPLLTFASVAGPLADGSRDPVIAGLSPVDDTDPMVGAPVGHPAPGACHQPVPAGGAMALDSAFYIARAADQAGVGYGILLYRFE